MRKTLLCSLFIFSAALTRAQGNLQFNAVKFYEFSATSGGTPYAEQAISITVPAGKVWKIESASATYATSSANSYTLASTLAGRITLNNKVIFEPTNSYTYPSMFPLWLPPGTYTLALKTNTSTAGYTCIGYVSAIEFNVVP